MRTKLKRVVVIAARLFVGTLGFLTLLALVFFCLQFLPWAGNWLESVFTGKQIGTALIGMSGLAAAVTLVSIWRS